MAIQIVKAKCLRCGYEWIPRHEDIRICPKCKSYHWDKPKEPKK